MYTKYIIITYIFYLLYIFPTSSFSNIFKQVNFFHRKKISKQAPEAFYKKLICIDCEKGLDKLYKTFPTRNLQVGVLESGKLYSRIFTHLAALQSARIPDSKSTHPTSTLATWSNGTRLQSWLWSGDPLISTTKRCLSPTYIKQFCLYHRYLESGKAKLWAWYFGSWIVVMFRLVARNRWFWNQILLCQQVLYNETFLNMYNLCKCKQ